MIGLNLTTSTSEGMKPNVTSDGSGKLPMPTREEINPYGVTDLDAESAAKNLNGRTIDDVIRVLQEGYLSPYDDMMWMGPRAFGYYIRAACRFILSPESKGCSDAVNHFKSTFLVRLDPKKAREVSLWAAAIPECISTCLYVLNNYDRFDVDPEIYGDLRPAFQNLLTKLESASKM